MFFSFYRSEPIDLNLLKMFSVLGCYFSAFTYNTLSNQFGRQNWAFFQGIKGQVQSGYLIKGVCTLPLAHGSESFMCEVFNAQIWYNITQIIWFCCQFLSAVIFVMLASIVLTGGRSMSTNLMLINWPQVLESYRNSPGQSNNYSLYSYIFAHVRPGGGYAM